MIMIIQWYAVCSMDDEGFCLAQNGSTLGLSIAQAIAVPCLNTNCSDSTCNSAVQSVRSMSIFSV